MCILAISGMAVTAIIVVAVIVIAVVFGAVKTFFPEKPRKPLRKA